MPFWSKIKLFAAAAAFSVKGAVSGVSAGPGGEMATLQERDRRSGRDGGESIEQRGREAGSGGRAGEEPDVGVVEELRLLDHKRRVRALVAAPPDRFHQWCGDIVADAVAAADSVGPNTAEKQDGEAERPRWKRTLPAGYALSLTTATAMPRLQFNQCFELLRMTSRDHYLNSIRAWDEHDKRAEMRTRGLRYLVVTQTDCGGGGGAGSGSATAASTLDLDCGPDTGTGTETAAAAAAASPHPVIAFLSFLPMLDPPGLVVNAPKSAPRLTTLFIYEVHTVPEHRGRSIGTTLLHLVDRIGARVGAVQTGLCVFDCNPGARRLYERIGYKDVPGRGMDEDWLEMMVAQTRSRWRAERDVVVRRMRQNGKRTMPRKPGRESGRGRGAPAAVEEKPQPDKDGRAADGEISDDNAVRAQIEAAFGRTTDEPGLFAVLEKTIPGSGA